MKQKLILVFSVLLLLIVVVWIIVDLFQGDSALQKNRYDYGMKEIRKQQGLSVYKEAFPMDPLLKEITAIACSKKGVIFVAGKEGVVSFDSSGRIITRITTSEVPACLTCLSEDTLVIGMTTHIELWKFSGRLISRWEQMDTNTIITSVAATSRFIYIADAGKKMVYQYGLDGKFRARIGERDPVRKIPGFVVPSPYFDVGISPYGELWVANTGRHQLEKYDEEGSLLTTWGEASQTLEGFTGCCNPSHFTFLADGSFITSEKGIERVKRYSSEGKFLEIVAGPDAFVEGTRGLDLTADSHGRILVLDPSRNQVRIFLPKK